MRLNLEVLALATRTMPAETGLHETESLALPVPAVPAKVMVRGFVAHVALGVVLTEKPTAAYATTIIRLMETPTRM